MFVRERYVKNGNVTTTNCLKTLAYFRSMALEMIDSVYTILDATVQECYISLCNITPSNDHSIIAEPDTSSCPADLDISNIRQFTRLLYIRDSRNTSQTSVNIPINIYSHYQQLNQRKTIRTPNIQMKRFCSVKQPI